MWERLSNGIREKERERVCVCVCVWCVQETLRKIVKLNECMFVCSLNMFDVVCETSQLLTLFTSKALPDSNSPQ